MLPFLIFNLRYNVLFYTALHDTKHITLTSITYTALHDTKHITLTSIIYTALLHKTLGNIT